MITSAGAQLITTGKVNLKQAITSGVIGYGIGFAGDYIGGQAGNVAGNIGLSPNVAAKVASASNAITIAAGTEYIQSGRITGKSVVMAGLSAALNSGEPSTVAGVKVADIVSTGQSLVKLIAARDELAAQRRQGAEYAAQMVELAALDAEIKRAQAEQAQAEQAQTKQAQTKQAKLAPVKAKEDIMPLMVAALFAAKLLIFS